MKSIIMTTLLLICSGSLMAGDLNFGGHKGVHRTMSAQPLGDKKINLGGTVQYGTEEDYIIKTTAKTDGNPHLLSGDIFWGLGITELLDIAINLPMHADIAGWDDRYDATIGDLEISTKYTLPFSPKTAFINHAIYVGGVIPTGNTEKGLFQRHVYYGKEGVHSSNGPYVSPQYIATFNFDRLSNLPLRYHFNGGAVVGEDRDDLAITSSMALEYFPRNWLTLFVEASTTILEKPIEAEDHVRNLNNGQAWLSPGARYTFENGAYMILSGEIGLSEEKEKYSMGAWNRYGQTYTTKHNPRYNIKYTVGWEGVAGTPDKDSDGIPNKEDNCPEDAEDKDGFQDNDGCPDRDNDADGVVDSADKCPNDSEDKDGFEDENGCPENDNDADGIADDADKCPDQSEDKDGFEDEDGCPDEDNDKDGILDSKDGCPTKAEDFDRFEDNDGCPDTDNDNDGVLDANDECPNTVGLESNNGCPAKVITRKGLILEGVQFASGRTVLKRSSYVTLNKVVESLTEWPNVKLEIQGHTDNTGKYSSNKRISQKRAETVLEYLVNKGIARKRLTAVGYGPDTPTASNSTRAGRAKNRRVEMKRVD